MQHHNCPYAFRFTVTAGGNWALITRRHSVKSYCKIQTGGTGNFPITSSERLASGSSTTHAYGVHPTFHVVSRLNILTGVRDPLSGRVEARLPRWLASRLAGNKCKLSPRGGRRRRDDLIAKARGKVAHDVGHPGLGAIGHPLAPTVAD